ncbi:MAG: aminopeptidase P N-terminal domain-containing protein [Gammaproteobacteria bacterium]
MTFKACLAQRRRRVLESLPPASLALIPAAQLAQRSADTYFPFRQNSDFYYLTDFTEPDALLVLSSGLDAPDEVLFCAPRDPLKERWEGEILGPERAHEQLGITTCLPLTELKQLSEWMAGCTQLYWPAANHAESKAAPFLESLQSAPELLNLDDILHEMRVIKDPYELDRMRQAATITDRAHRRMMRKVQAGMHEYELEAEGLYEFSKAGARSPAYASIVGGGANACVLHYTANQAPLNPTDLVLIDAGCEWMGYASDITRTFPVSGRYSPEQKALYEIVLNAQQTVIAALKPGLPYPQAQNIAIKTITEGLVHLGILQGSMDHLLETEAWRAFYMHRVGHWLGMDVHDVGSYEQNGQPRLLEPGMVMTVEPGIYIDPQADVAPQWQGIGIRIEDDLLITEQGAEILGAAPPKSIEDIEHLMASG